MLKWIGGGCLVLVLIVGVLMYVSYRKMSEIADEGPAVSMMIGAPPARVFASLANSDSLPTWHGGSSSRTSRQGMLASGDTLFDTVRDSSPGRMAWIVDTVIANQLIAMRAVNLASGQILFRRRDSLTAVGDSTRVTSMASMWMMDSVAAGRARGGVSGGIMNAATRMGVAGLRVQVQQDLERLKRRIEGTPVARPDSG